MSTLQVQIKTPIPYPFQRKILNSPQRNKFLVCSRQVGKTVTSSLEAIGDLLKGRHVLWAASKQDQLPKPYKRLCRILQPLITHTHKNREIVIQGGGEIQFRSTTNPDNLRSDNYNLLILDEYATAAPDTLNILLPTLAATNGRIVISTTPAGFNHCHDFWVKCKADPKNWYCLQADYTIAPHFHTPAGRKVIADAKGKMSPTKFRQEFMAEWISREGSKFPYEWLEHILVDSIPDVFQKSCVSVDLSKGHANRSDYQAVCFVGWQNNSFWVDIRQDRMPLPTLVQTMKLLHKHWRPTNGFILENNGDQQIFINDFIKSFSPEPCPFIGRFNASEDKDIRIARLGYWLERGEVKLLRNAGSELLWKQLSDWPMAEQVKDGGVGDDGPDALIQGIQFLTTPRKK